MIFVTGGAGFIGTQFVADWLRQRGEPIRVLDALTYAGCRDNLPAPDGSRYDFILVDVCDSASLADQFERHQPRAIVHLAAETHVDRSIAGPDRFVRTNIQGTFSLLETARRYFNGLAADARNGFRFIQVSTDEVYGSLSDERAPFVEESCCLPNNPYAASKAAADHLVRAYVQTYGLPAIITRCCNNYGPYQFPEKLIPRMVSLAREAQPLPLFGDGRQIRDWIHVADHCAALRRVLDDGRPGRTYNIGARCEISNLDLVTEVCRLLDELCPAPCGIGCASLIRHVGDRPAHDRRYAIDPSRIERELGWKATTRFDEGLRRTVQWYLDHSDWIARMQRQRLA